MFEGWIREIQSSGLFLTQICFDTLKIYLKWTWDNYQPQGLLKGSMYNWAMNKSTSQHFNTNRWNNLLSSERKYWKIATLTCLWADAVYHFNVEFFIVFLSLLMSDYVSQHVTHNVCRLHFMLCELFLRQLLGILRLLINQYPSLFSSFSRTFLSTMPGKIRHHEF